MKVEEMENKKWTVQTRKHGQSEGTKLGEGLVTFFNDDKYHLRISISFDDI